MASDYFLELDGVKGEAQDALLKGNLDIDSFSWGVSNAGSMAGGGGGGGGKCSFQDLHFTGKVSKASPILAINCATGTHIKKAVLHVRKSGKDPQEFYTITLTDCLISSYQSGGHEGSGLPTDQFSINYAKIKFEYKPQKPDGSLDTAIATTYDVKANKAG